MGLRLGAVWERQRLSVPLGGNLSKFEAKAVVMTANVEQFPPVELAFAWTRDRNAPLILGHMNFFLAFDVYFLLCCGLNLLSKASLSAKNLKESQPKLAGL